MENLDQSSNNESSKPAVFAAALLIAAGLLMTFSMKDDTLTTDETLYVPTGYLYLTERNSRIGFEHPPLIRDIAALPLLFLNLKPASQFLDPNSPSAGLNDAVWKFGEDFLFHQTMHSHEILFWARLPIVVMTLAFGLLIFVFVKRNWGTRAGMLALLLYLLSPYVLAHGRLATTDMGTALGAYLCILALMRSLQEPSWLRITVAGLALAVALLIKFALFTLVPFFLLSLMVWAWISSEDSTELRRALIGAFARFIAMLAICFLVIDVFYAFHVWNYPAGQQSQDIAQVLASARNVSSEKIWFLLNLADWSVTRPLAHYFYGMIWQFSRSGAFGYFAGEGSYGAWKLFYPFGYFVKQPLEFHAMAAIAIFYFVSRIQRIREKGPLSSLRIKALARENAFVLMGLGWVFYYGFILIFVNSGNTGSRYLLPTLPVIFSLVAIAVDGWIGQKKSSRSRLRAVAVLVFVQALSVIAIYPSFLSYFNETVGSRGGGYYLVDTDLEWGQDVKRLADWLKAKGVVQFKVAHAFQTFSPESPTPRMEQSYSASYPEYLGSYTQLAPDVPSTGWIIVPGRVLYWGQAKPASHQGWGSNSYRWLGNHEPVARIGYSIYVYYIE